MESTINFSRAFETVFDEKKAAGQVDQRDSKLIASMLAHPACTTKQGLRVNRMARTHRRVRRMYLRQHDLPSSMAIDWNSILDWIRENWLEIVKALLFILFLFL